MAPLAAIQFETRDALLDKADAWDDLWRRSAATLPSLRARPLAHWLEHFASAAAFAAVVIKDDEHWLAALPLVRRKVARVLHAGTMPCNDWAACGDLLLDENADAPATLDALAAGLRECDWPLLWLQESQLDASRWRQFSEACQRSGMATAQHPCWQVGRVVIDHAWEAYRARWSRKHRQKMAYSLRRLAQRGEVRLDLQSQFTPSDVASVLRQCFKLEDRGWKGQASSSVLRQPGLFDFYLRQAQLAAADNHLELARLYCGERLAAFSLGLSAKGVFHSTKVSYEPDFADEQPGQLLRYLMLERFFTEPDRKALDFQGPITEAHAAWLPERYAVGRLAMGARGWIHRGAVWSYRHVWPIFRRHYRPSHKPST